MADDVKSCQSCGASIYREHLDRGMAGFVAGKLLCTVCRNQALGGGAPVAAAAPAATAAVDPSEETIRLVDESEVSTSVSPGGSMLGDTRTPLGRTAGAHVLSRPLLKGQSAATRCRTFHAKLSEGALTYMDEQFNDWCDKNQDIEVKFATQVVGIFEGKHSTEQHLILTVFY